MTLYEELLEHDLNPFILFDGDGKIKNFNKEAEFLLNFVSPKELFDLTVSYASKTFGFRREFINITYEKQSFYAILVGYMSDDEIILRLYKEVSSSKTTKLDDNNLKETNLFTLIELSKSTTLLGCNLIIEEVYDVSIPLIKLNVNDFLLCINNIFEQLKNQKNITLKVHIKTGEYEVINNKKYKIIAIDFIAKEKVEFYPLTNKVNKNEIMQLLHKNNTIKLELPLIV
jgi:nitrogen-specific signal transduction histidine kinase